MAYQIQIPARSRRSGILNIATAHEERRRSTINLVASENLMSPAALKMLGSDFAHRYCIPPAGERPAEIWDYPNQRFSRALEAEAKELACELFHGKTADVRPLSGNNIVGILLTSLHKGRRYSFKCPAKRGRSLRNDTRGAETKADSSDASL